MPAQRSLRRDALGIWTAGVDAVHAGRLVHKAVRSVRKGVKLAGTRYSLGNEGRLVVIGAGKASAAMAQGMETAIAGSRIEDRLTGWVNVPDAHVRKLNHIHLHPSRSGVANRPTAAAVKGTRRMLDEIAGLGKDDLVVVLLSGGGSALLPQPAEGITLGDKQRVTDLLHRCGATIEEMNTVRKHLSAVKGGRLVQATGARVVTLIVSDVIGDPLDAIASGPTAADPTTFADALAVLRKFDLGEKVPDSVLAHLKAGASGKHPETPNRLPKRVDNVILANNRTALDAAAREARRLGYKVVDLGSRLEGESRELGHMLAGLVRGVRAEGRPASPPVCILSGGETTVTLKGKPGKGGRNQELVLSALERLGSELKGAIVLSGGTDGEDGPTDAAGAFADQRVAQRAQREKVVAGEHLERHDAYPFFRKAGGLFMSGPTGTNVMDLRVVIVRE